MKLKAKIRVSFFYHFLPVSSRTIDDFLMSLSIKGLSTETLIKEVSYVVMDKISFNLQQNRYLRFF